MALDDLSKKSVEGMQADYFIKEQQSVQKLHKLQTGLAEQLYAARLALQNKLIDEARKSGQGVEDYLSQYGLKQRLDSLAEETKARRIAFEGDEKSLYNIKLQNQNRLKLADQALAKLAKDNEKKLAALKQQSAAALKKLETEAAAETLAATLSGEETTTAAVTERLKLEAQERARLAKTELDGVLEVTDLRLAQQKDLAAQVALFDSEHASALSEAERAAAEIRAGSLIAPQTLPGDTQKARETFNAKQEAFNRLLEQANRLDGLRLLNSSQTEEALSRQLVQEKLLLKNKTIELETAKAAEKSLRAELATLDEGSAEYVEVNKALKEQLALQAQLNAELEDQIETVKTLQDEVSGTSMTAIGEWLEDAKKKELAVQKEVTFSMLESLKKTGASYEAVAAAARGKEGIDSYKAQLEAEEEARRQSAERLFVQSEQYANLGATAKLQKLEEFRALQEQESAARIAAEMADVDRVAKYKSELEAAHDRTTSLRMEEEAAKPKPGESTFELTGESILSGFGTVVENLSEILSPDNLKAGFKNVTETLKPENLKKGFKEGLGKLKETKVGVKTGEDAKAEREKRESAKKALAEVNPALAGDGKGALLANLKMSEADKAAAAEKLMKDNPGMKMEEADNAVASARLESAVDSLHGIVTSLAKSADEISKTALKVNTQMQGIKESRGGGSYWDSLNDKIGYKIGMSPIVSQEKVIKAAQSLLDAGIAFNLEQRAFLEGIKEGIAGTFNAADGTLLKLIRIQQADSTAARLGMESALTMFMNSMYATSEYMVEAAKGVRDALYEAQALMDSSDALSVEYQVQKWVGSLYSVGFSKSNELSQAIGKYLAGDLEGLTDGGFGNLLLMATERAGMNVADILEKGLDSEGINELLREIVAYLGDIYKETHGSNVLSQQYAQVFGVSASDLKAAANLSNSMNKVASTYMEEADFLGQLKMMVGGLYTRTGTVGLLDNLKSNMSYMMSEGLGNSAVSYITNELAGLLQEFAGGIEIPFINVMGFGLDLNASIATLMKIAAMSGPVLSMLGKTIAGLGNLDPSNLLSAFGVDEGITRVKARGATVGKTLQKGASVSESGYVGNESSSDTQEKTMQDASEDGNSQIAEAKEEEDDVKLKQVDEHIVKIYELLDAVTTGSKSFYVAMAGGSAPSGTAWTP